MAPPPNQPGEATSATLLSRLRDPSDHAAWAEFETRYRGLLVRFCVRQGLQHADAEDIVQAVTANLLKSMPQFVYAPGRGRFRDYLYRCTRNALSAWRARAARPVRRAGALDSRTEDALAANAAERPDALAERAWEEEWVAHHYRLAMRTARETFEPGSIEIFNRSIRGETLGAIATGMGMSEEAVKKARQRVRARLEELISRQIAEEDDARGS